MSDWKINTHRDVTKRDLSNKFVISGCKDGDYKSLLEISILDPCIKIIENEDNDNDNVSHITYCSDETIKEYGFESISFMVCVKRTGGEGERG